MEVGKLRRAGREGEQARPARVLLRNEPPQALPFGGHCGLHPRALHRGVSASHRAHGDLVSAGDKVDRKSTRLNSSHGYISYAVFCLKKKKTIAIQIKRTDDGKVTDALYHLHQ